MYSPAIITKTPTAGNKNVVNNAHHHHNSWLPLQMENSSTWLLAHISIGI